MAQRVIARGGRCPALALDWLPSHSSVDKETGPVWYVIEGETAHVIAISHKRQDPETVGARIETWTE